jgi:hypothetical protein
VTAGPAVIAVNKSIHYDTILKADPFRFITDPYYRSGQFMAGNYGNALTRYGIGLHGDEFGSKHVFLSVGCTDAAIIYSYLNFVLSRMRFLDILKP